MDAIVFVAFAGVGPVDDVDRAVGAVVEVDAAEPGVGGLGDVGLVAGDVAAAFAVEPIDVDAAAVEVEGEELAAIFGGPVVAEIDAGAAVGVAAAELVDGVVLERFFPAAAGVVVKMVGVGVDRVIDAAVGTDRGAAGVVSAGDEVKEVAGDGVGDEGFAVFVPVHAPGIGEAVAEDFENFARRMIAPDAAVDGGALFLLLPGGPIQPGLEAPQRP